MIEVVLLVLLALVSRYAVIIDGGDLVHANGEALLRIIITGKL